MHEDVIEMVEVVVMVVFVFIEIVLLDEDQVVSTSKVNVLVVVANVTVGYLNEVELLTIKLVVDVGAIVQTNGVIVGGYGYEIDASSCTKLALSYA